METSLAWELATFTLSLLRLATDWHQPPRRPWTVDATVEVITGQLGSWAAMTEHALSLFHTWWHGRSQARQGSVPALP